MLADDRAWDVLRTADLVVSADAINAALVRLAGEINARLAGTTPLVVSVMGGAVVFTGRILPMLEFPLEFDFLHVTRYGDATRGGHIEWKVWPRSALTARTVLVLDDILDEGVTLAAIRDGLRAEGAAAVYTAVFADKAIGRPKPLVADLVGVRVPDRFVFGFGMDVHGAWRNLPAIYALRNEAGAEPRLTADSPPSRA
jgi:hypoxanthine phosphoribosyltransferase